ncbi:MAG: hypothetical protein EP329_04850 [Deltaproteobacteria bacterium]|nr:MAG: hypothetical protein EP329_04850 [Deltaproteobacteria bacterium]
MRRRGLLTGALLASLLFAPSAGAEDGDFPQLKINYVDVSQAPKVNVYFSILLGSMRPAVEDDLREVVLAKKPEGAKQEDLFSFVDGEVVWPKSMSDEEKKQKGENPPTLLPAIDAEIGASIVVVAPGFQDEDYIGALGERSRNGTGIFFKKLGKTNDMNVVWYTDDIWTYVYTEGRTTQLTKLSTMVPQCAKWKREQAEKFGVEPDPDEAAAVGPVKGQAECGLASAYDEIPGAVKKRPIAGFWPQLFGITPVICADVKEGERPSWDRHSVGGGAEGESKSLTNPDGLTAIDVALKMLIDGGKPGKPKILVLTGDGRDGYVHRWDDCRIKFERDCGEDPAVANLSGRAQRAALNKCVDDQMNKVRADEQGKFAQKVETWLALAKGAGIRIFSVIHPTGSKYQHDRLEVLAWRTGGTARVANDVEEVVSQYEDLISELNNQFVITYADDAAVPDAEMQYVIQAKVGTSKYTSKPFKQQVGSVIEKPFLAEVKDLGEGKLGKTGFLVVLIAVGLVLLLILLKIVKKFAKSGEGAAKKAAKGGKGADKAKAKAKEKAKKEALKKAKAKAKAKAKKG